MFTVLPSGIGFFTVHAFMLRMMYAITATLVFAFAAEAVSAHLCPSKQAAANVGHPLDFASRLASRLAQLVELEYTRGASIRHVLALKQETT